MLLKSKMAVVVCMISILFTGCANSKTKNDTEIVIQEEDVEITIQNDDGEVLASTSDFAKARLRNLENTLGIEVTFKEDGKIKEITEAHVGEVIHIFLGEEVISSPRITMAFSGKGFILEGDYTEETAEQFVDRINNQ